MLLLRIEDIDQTRCRLAWEEQIFEDLAWLGISWPEPVLRQSQNMQAYQKALDALWRRGLLYACHCNRRDIQAAASAPQEGAPLVGPDGLIYPGTCRSLPRMPNDPIPTKTPLRLDLAAASELLPQNLSFEETRGTQNAHVERIEVASLCRTIGDVVLSRRDMGTSYHLSVVLDDAAQGITDVVRGEDLFDATAIHAMLQKLMGLPTPKYHHHKLIRDDAGKRLAKRDDARAISKYRAEGASPEELRRLVGMSG